MPYSFTLPTTSSLSYPNYFTSDSHPSLPLAASVFRGVLRDTLKKHKRLPPAEQASHLPSILLSLNNYIPYLFALEQGLGSEFLTAAATTASTHNTLNVALKSTPIFKWRPSLSENPVPGREIARLKVQSLEYEIYFALSTLAYSHTLLSRVSLHSIYSMSSTLPTSEQRMLAITTATKHLLTAGSIHDYLCNRSEKFSYDQLSSIDLSQSTLKALASLALAEATILAVLKDDPYPAIIVQDRNKSDKEWMIKPPEIPKVRANLLARLCLAAAEHASNAQSLLNTLSSKNQGKISAGLLKYIQEFKKSSRGKACRFFGIGAETEGQIGTAIGWLRAGIYELGLTSDEESKWAFKKFKRGWEERREEKRVEKEMQWGNDGGRIEEGRILEFLNSKWSKINDLMNTQTVPPIGPLIANIPSGRDIYILKSFIPPNLEKSILEDLKAPFNPDELRNEESSDEEGECNARDDVVNVVAHNDYSGRGNYY